MLHTDPPFLDGNGFLEMVFVPTYSSYTSRKMTSDRIVSPHPPSLKTRPLENFNGLRRDLPFTTGRPAFPIIQKA
jgi:hypothetical protein